MAVEARPSADRKYSIAVVGGGIGGLCTVIGLLQEGVDVQVYEGVPRSTSRGCPSETDADVDGPQPLRPSQRSEQASHWVPTRPEPWARSTRGSTKGFSVARPITRGRARRSTGSLSAKASTCTINMASTCLACIARQVRDRQGSSKVGREPKTSE